MKNTQKPTVIARRDLLKIAPLAGVAVCASGAAEADTPELPGQTDDPRQVRMADTQHVRTYYKLARE